MLIRFILQKDGKNEIRAISKESLLEDIIGEYETEERAKEVFSEIIDFYSGVDIYSSIINLKDVLPKIEARKISTFYMPEK